MGSARGWPGSYSGAHLVIANGGESDHEGTNIEAWIRKARMSIAPQMADDARATCTMPTGFTRGPHLRRR